MNLPGDARTRAGGRERPGGKTFGCHGLALLLVFGWGFAAAWTRAGGPEPISPGGTNSNSATTAEIQTARRDALALPAAQAAGLPTTPVPPGSGEKLELDSAGNSPQTNVQFSAIAPSARWQKSLTLGPGDVLDFSLFGHRELARTGLPIGPDGRVSFLEARDILASGLTVDELRERFNQELSRYRRSPFTVITPVSFSSKKFFMLGGVVQKGVFTLDRPMTVIEAVAEAHGLETELSGGDQVEVVDLSRSFLARGGHRLAVDFTRLFQQGDLTQNILIEPGDYLYFPPAAASEVYVLGEIRYPGPVPFAGNLGVVGLIAAQGGFTDKAWKKRVLVIRGSLSKPETFVVDSSAVLDAQALDFRLEPRDIVYVSARPWARAEELLDNAATAFVQSAVLVWTGLHVDPLIK